MFGSFGKILRKCIVYLLFLIVGAAIGMHGLQNISIEVMHGFTTFFGSLFKSVPGGTVKL